jgi:hypothetical protein
MTRDDLTDIIWEEMQNCEGDFRAAARNVAEVVASSQAEFIEALREARQFVVIHGPRAAFPDVVAHLDAVLAKHGRVG